MKGSSKGRYFEKMMKKKTAIAAILFFVLALPAFAETKTWTGGGTDNKWSTGENWSGGAVPGAGDNASFTGTGSLEIELDQSAPIGKIDVSDGRFVTLRIADGKTLTVSGEGGTGFHISAGGGLTLRYLGSTPGGVTLQGDGEKFNLYGRLEFINVRLSGAPKFSAQTSGSGRIFGVLDATGKVTITDVLQSTLLNCGLRANEIEVTNWCKMGPDFKPLENGTMKPTGSATIKHHSSSSLINGEKILTLRFDDARSTLAVEKGHTVTLDKALITTATGFKKGGEGDLVFKIPQTGITAGTIALGGLLTLAAEDALGGGITIKLERNAKLAFDRAGFTFPGTLELTSTPAIRVKIPDDKDTPALTLARATTGDPRGLKIDVTEMTQLDKLVLGDTQKLIAGTLTNLKQKDIGIFVGDEEIENRYIVETDKPGASDPSPTYVNLVKKKPLYSITSQMKSLSSAAGQISPSGTYTVEENGEVTYRIEADPGSAIANILIDGVTWKNEYNGVEEYRFTNVTSDHKIAAYFVPAGSEMVTLNITANGGRVEPLGKFKYPKDNGNVDVTVYFNTASDVESIKIDETAYDLSKLGSGTQHTLKIPTDKDHHVNVLFKTNTPSTPGGSGGGGGGGGGSTITSPDMPPAPPAPDPAPAPTGPISQNPAEWNLSVGSADAEGLTPVTVVTNLYLDEEPTAVRATGEATQIGRASCRERV